MLRKIAKDTFDLTHEIVVANLERYLRHSSAIPPVVVNTRGVKVPCSICVMRELYFCVVFELYFIIIIIIIIIIISKI